MQLVFSIIDEFVYLKAIVLMIYGDTIVAQNREMKYKSVSQRAIIRTCGFGYFRRNSFVLYNHMLNSVAILAIYLVN